MLYHEIGGMGGGMRKRSSSNPKRNSNRKNRQRLAAKRQDKVLSAIQVNNTWEPGRYVDGGCLHFVVDPGGVSRHWVLRVTVHGVRRDIGLGPYPLVSLAE